MAFNVRHKYLLYFVFSILGAALIMIPSLLGMDIDLFIVATCVSLAAGFFGKSLIDGFLLFIPYVVGAAIGFNCLGFFRPADPHSQQAQHFLGLALIMLMYNGAGFMFWLGGVPIGVWIRKIGFRRRVEKGQ